MGSRCSRHKQSIESKPVQTAFVEIKHNLLAATAIIPYSSIIDAVTPENLSEFMPSLDVKAGACLAVAHYRSKICDPDKKDTPMWYLNEIRQTPVTIRVAKSTAGARLLILTGLEPINWETASTRLRLAVEPVMCRQMESCISSVLDHSLLPELVLLIVAYYGLRIQSDVVSTPRPTPILTNIPIDCLPYDTNLCITFSIELVCQCHCRIVPDVCTESTL